MQFPINYHLKSASQQIKEQSSGIEFLYKNQLPIPILGWDFAAGYTYQNYYLPFQYPTYYSYENTPHLSEPHPQKPTQDWAFNELLKLKKLYEQHGPRWAFLRSKFSNKNQVSIKNKFRNGIRSSARILNCYQGKSKRNKKTITNSLLTIMLNFVYQLQKIIENLNLTINPNNIIYEFRTKIIDLSLKIREFNEEELIDLIGLIKAINSKIRCFGIFKINNVKDWKIKKENLEAVCQFFNIVKKDNAWQELMREKQIDISLHENLLKVQEMQQKTPSKEIEEQKEDINALAEQKVKVQENSELDYFLNLSTKQKTPQKS